MTVAYQLGVDLGTTYTAAAVGRAGGVVEISTLSPSNPVMPSVISVRDDGEMLVGEPAVRRGQTDPGRTAREFKRRLGDPTPLVLGKTPYSAESLMARLLREVVDIVTAREGAPPTATVLTLPANYGPYKVEMMREVARLAGLDLATTYLLSEPQAAAIAYATRDRVEPDQRIAVYDFGGGTFDAAVLVRTATGFELLGQPEGLDRFGGIDIDAAIVAHLDELVEGALGTVDHDDPAVQSGMQRLREDCRSAKESLSSDRDTTIDVSLPGVQQRVILTRQELEDMIRPRLRETTDALRRSIASAGLEADEIDRILLVGGSSRIPLVGEMVARTMGRPVALDAHPKFAIATGAAAFDVSGVAPMKGFEAPPPIAPVSVPPPPAAPKAPTKPSGRRNVLVGAALVVALIVGVVIATSGSSDDTTLPTVKATEPDSTTSDGDDPAPANTQPSATEPEPTDPPRTDPPKTDPPATDPPATEAPDPEIDTARAVDGFSRVFSPFESTSEQSFSVEDCPIDPRVVEGFAPSSVAVEKYGYARGFLYFYANGSSMLCVAYFAGTGRTAPLYSISVTSSQVFGSSTESVGGALEQFPGATVEVGRGTVGASCSEDSCTARWTAPGQKLVYQLSSRFATAGEVVAWLVDCIAAINGAVEDADVVAKL